MSKTCQSVRMSTSNESRQLIDTSTAPISRAASQRALQIQENAFADIARRRSVNDLKSQSRATSDGIKRYQSAEEAEQIRFDEELAKKISLEDNTVDASGLNDRTNPQPRQDYQTPEEAYLSPPSYSPSLPNERLNPVSPTINGNLIAGSDSYFPYRVEPLRISKPRSTLGNSPKSPQTQPTDCPDTNTFDLPPDQPRRESLGPWNSHKMSPKLTSPSPRERLAVCDQCRTEQPFVSYCPACSFHFCHNHWDAQILHHTPRLVNGVPHEKTDPHLAKRIKSIIEPSISEEEQNRLHREDDDTTWFGVLPDANGQLLFHDFGRYEEFLSQSMYAPKSGQFPSLISFVGPTGAGKSTIVKALVQLSDPGIDNQKQQTPVVGLVEHQTVPTSSEVHLFWDPSSLLSNRPLIYADCEGLGAGNREPRAAIATATKDKKTLTKERKEKDGKRTQYDPFSPYDLPSQPSKALPGRNPNLRQSIPSYSSMSPRNTPMPPPPGSRRPSVSAIDTSSVPASYSPWSAAEQGEAHEGWSTGCEKIYRGVTRKIRWAQERERRSRQFIVENLYPRILYTFSDIVILVMRNPK
jgi:hypothetical protein